MRNRSFFLKCFCFLSVIIRFVIQADQHPNTFPIEEDDLMQIMQEKLAKTSEKDLEEKQQEWKKVVIRALESPKPVQGIGETSEYRRTFFDPSIVVNEDITDLNGNRVATKGTTINPLEINPLSAGLLLFDGTNPDHIRWAKDQSGKFKWVLINGRPLELEKQENRPVFFDQEGSICHQFDVTHVPCRILQQGKRLLIEEIPLKRSE